MKATTGARRRSAMVVPIAPYGDVALHELPDLISENAALTGHPIVVDLPVGAPVSTQRLLASLGVAVRFVEAPTDPPRPRVPPPPRDAVRDAVRDVVRRTVDADRGDDRGDDPLARRARTWLAEA